MARYPGYFDENNYGNRNPELGIMHSCITHGHPLPDEPPANFLFLAIRMLSRYEGYEEMVSEFSKKLASIIMKEGIYRNKLEVYDLHVYRYYMTGLCVMKDSGSWNNSERAVILDSFDAPESAKPKKKEPEITKAPTINEYKGISELAKSIPPAEYLQFRQYLKEVREKNVTITPSAGYVKELRKVGTFFERYDNFIKTEETMKEMPERHMVMAEQFGMIRVPDYRFSIYIQDKVPDITNEGQWHQCGEYTSAVTDKGFKITIESGNRTILSLLATPNELTEAMESDYRTCANSITVKGGTIVDLTNSTTNKAYDLLRQSRAYHRAGLYSIYDDRIYIPILTDEMFDYYEALSRSNAHDRYNIKNAITRSTHNDDPDETIDEHVVVIPKMFSEKQWGTVSDIGLAKDAVVRNTNTYNTIKNTSKQILSIFLNDIFNVTGKTNTHRYGYGNIPSPSEFKYTILHDTNILNNENLEPLRTLLVLAEISTLRQSIGITASGSALIYNREMFPDVEKEVVLLKEAITKIAQSKYGSLVIKAGKLERYVIPEEEE